MEGQLTLDFSVCKEENEFLPLAYKLDPSNETKDESEWKKTNPAYQHFAKEPELTKKEVTEEIISNNVVKNNGDRKWHWYPDEVPEEGISVICYEPPGYGEDIENLEEIEKADGYKYICEYSSNLKKILTHFVENINDKKGFYYGYNYPPIYEQQDGDIKAWRYGRYDLNDEK